MVAGPSIDLLLVVLPIHNLILTTPRLLCIVYKMWLITDLVPWEQCVCTIRPIGGESDREVSRAEELIKTLGPFAPESPFLFTQTSIQHGFCSSTPSVWCKVKYGPQPESARFIENVKSSKCQDNAALNKQSEKGLRYLRTKLSPSEPLPSLQLLLHRSLCNCLRRIWPKEPHLCKQSSVVPTSSPLPHRFPSGGLIGWIWYVITATSPCSWRDLLGRTRPSYLMKFLLKRGSQSWFCDVAASDPSTGVISHCPPSPGKDEWLRVRSVPYKKCKSSMEKIMLHRQSMHAHSVSNWKCTS